MVGLDRLDRKICSMFINLLYKYSIILIDAVYISQNDNLDIKYLLHQSNV